MSSTLPKFIPSFLRGMCVVWDGWNLDPIYNLIPHKGIQNYHEIKTEKANYAYNLIILSPNLTGNRPTKYIAHPGDVVYYDSSMSGVSIIKGNSAKSSIDGIIDDIDCGLLKAYDNIKQNMIKIFISPFV